MIYPDFLKEGDRVNGYNKIKSFAPKQLIVFCVGFTPKAKVDLKKIAEDNKLGDTPLYYFEGGTNPPKMGFIGRKVVEMVTKEKVTYQDNTDKKATAGLLKAVKSLSIKLRERFLDYQIYYLNLD